MRLKARIASSYSATISTTQTQRAFWGATKQLGLIGLGLFGAIAPALAHHPFGGRAPANVFEGFLSGLGHPVIGLDHLAAVVAIGLLATGRRRGALIPVAFLITAMLGTSLHLHQVNLPGAELAIALSVVILGGLLAFEQRLSSVVLSLLLAIAGLFHGYAYGEAVIGAQMTPIVAYLAGFTLIQYTIAMAASAIAGKVTQQLSNQSNSLFRGVGSVISLLGLAFLVTALTS